MAKFCLKIVAEKAHQIGKKCETNYVVHNKKLRGLKWVIEDNSHSLWHMLTIKPILNIVFAKKFNMFFWACATDIVPYFARPSN